MQGRGHEKAQVTEVKRVICGDRLNRGVALEISVGNWEGRSGCPPVSDWEGRPQAGNSLVETSHQGVCVGGGGRVGGYSLLSSGSGRKCGSGNLDRLSEDTDFSQRGLSVVRCQAC